MDDNGDHNLDMSDIIYPISWEDGECDIVEYGLSVNSRICMITTGGDNVLVYLTRDVRSIYTFDINPHQNHWLEMKMAVILTCKRREDALRILGQNDYDLFVARYPTIRSHLRTEGARAYWDRPTNQEKFKSLFRGHWTSAPLVSAWRFGKYACSHPHLTPIVNELAKRVAPLQGVPHRQYEMMGGFDKNSADTWRAYFNYLDKTDGLASYFYTGFLNGRWDGCLEGCG